MLPRPTPNMEKYRKTMDRRFAKNPTCKENYEKYLSSAREGHKIGCDFLPIKMDYEVSSHCNFKCTMCLLSEIGNDRPDNMSIDNFRENIDMQQGLIEVKLQGIGEPLLNVDFFQMVDYAVEQDIWVRTATNASLLHINGNYRKMIDSGIGEIQISVDGATKETFEKIRIDSNFETVVNNCRLINEYAESKGEQWKTSCWMLVQKENVDEVDRFLELAAEMKFTRITYSIAVSDYSHDGMAKINGEKEVKDIFTDEYAEKLIRRGKELGITVTFWDGKDKYVYDEKKDKICAWLFSRAYISADMRIVPCCVVCDSNVCDMGDAHDFTNEWNSKKYQALRREHLQGDIPKMCWNCYENTT